MGLTVDTGDLYQREGIGSFPRRFPITPDDYSSDASEQLHETQYSEGILTPISKSHPVKRTSRKSKPSQSVNPNEKHPIPGYIIKLGIGSEKCCILRNVNYEPLPEELRPLSKIAYCNIFRRTEVKKSTPIKKKKQKLLEITKSSKIESPNNRTRRSRTIAIPIDDNDVTDGTDSSIDLME